MAQLVADAALDLHPGGRAGDRHRGPVRLRDLVERVPRRPGRDEQGLGLHAAADPRCGPRETSLGGTDWGMLQAGITVSMIPCIGDLPAAAEVLRVGLHQRGASSDRRTRAPGRRRRHGRPADAGGDRPLSPLAAGRRGRDRRLLGRALRTNRERTIPHGWTSSGLPGTWPTSAGGRGSRPVRALGEVTGVIFPFLDYRRLQVARGRRLGARARARSRPRRLRGRGDRARRTLPSARTAT